MTEEQTLEDLTKRRRLAAVRMLHTALVGDLSDDDRDLAAANLRNDLTDSERANLMLLLLQTFPADQAAELVQGAFKGAGFPSVALMEEPLAEARFWATDANAKELRAYAMACFERMSGRTRKAFREWAAKHGS